MWPIRSRDSQNIVTLLQEQNALTRELIQALTHKPATTIHSPISVSAGPTQPRPRPKLTREYTAKDVTVVTAEMREQQAIALFEKTERPWRIQDLPAEAQAAALASLPVDLSPVHKMPMAEMIAEMNEVTRRVWREAHSTSAPSATGQPIPPRPPTS